MKTYYGKEWVNTNLSNTVEGYNFIRLFPNGFYVSASPYAV